MKKKNLAKAKDKLDQDFEKNKSQSITADLNQLRSQSNKTATDDKLIEEVTSEKASVSGKSKGKPVTPPVPVLKPPKKVVNVKPTEPQANDIKLQKSMGKSAIGGLSGLLGGSSAPPPKPQKAAVKATKGTEQATRPPSTMEIKEELAEIEELPMAEIPVEEKVPEQKVSKKGLQTAVGVEFMKAMKKSQK